MMEDNSKKVRRRACLTMSIWVLNIANLCVMLCLRSTEGHYLRVASRWLVKEADGERTKLACVNWAGHLETMVPEGLNRQPLQRLGLAVKGMGFNCVRLTFATYMFTDPTLSNLTVAESFTRMGLQHSLRGIAIHNPDLLHLPIQAAFVNVIARLTHAGLLIIVDNHVSKPQWCCGIKDGNGFWGDTFFNAGSWVQGLSSMASLVKNNSEVVGMSLRNELRGPKQNTQDWYKYMSLGAKAVHKANPNLLIILSGLHYDTDLRFVAKNHFSNLPFQDKLVYEMHWYTSSYGSNFAKGNLNKACAIATSSITKSGAYMTNPSALSNKSFVAPLFISEFGIDQRGGNKGNNRFINCFFAFMASMDLDWAYWPLQGSYYVRNGQEGDEEFYGILNSQWSAPRNISLLARLQAIQQPWQSGKDKNSSSPRSGFQVLFHPATGLCVRKGSGNKLLLASCMESTTTHWRYTPQGRLEMKNSYLCIASDGEGQFAKLKTVGTETNGPWTLASIAKLQFATFINSSLDSSQITSNDTNPTFHLYDPNQSPQDQLDSFPDNNGLYRHVYYHHYGSDIDSNDHRHGREYHNNHSKDGDDDDDDNSANNIIDNLINIPQSSHQHNPLLCLDGSTPPSITTKRCICVQANEMDCQKDDDPSSQWFVLIYSDTHPSAYGV